MKKIIFSLIGLIYLTNIYGQRYCGSELNLTELQQADTVRYQRIMNLENATQFRLAGTNSIPQSTIIIPVVVHILYNNSSQNVSEQQVYAQIQVLNEDFRRLNNDQTNTPSAFAGIAGDANVEFRLAKIDPDGNLTSGITRTYTSQTDFSHVTENMKFTNEGGHDAWNSQKYLNIWVCNFTSTTLLGYAQFPDEPRSLQAVKNKQLFGQGSTLFALS
jgi:hypothetical protein